MGKNLKKWRESASLILAANTKFNSVKNSVNFKILSLKRSSKSDYMPDTYVFPGGNLSASDSSIEWLDLFRQFGFSNETFDEIKLVDNNPEILRSASEGGLSRDISFRICAIREAFEECGILLCKTPKISSIQSNKWASFMGGSELIQWQHRVHDDSSEFLHLCTKFHIYPDILALKNWSHWLTPPVRSVKFNTIFFLATLNQMPPSQADAREIDALMWTTPEEIIKMNNSKEIMLPVPQHYELSRLKMVANIQNLADFAHERSKLGFDSYWPSRVRTKEGIYTILPGDDLYPNEIDPDQKEMTFIDHLPDSEHQHRLLHKSAYDNRIIVRNIRPNCGHIIPKSDE